jgi:uncharacterized protein (DUF58 family)
MELDAFVLLLSGSVGLLVVGAGLWWDRRLGAHARGGVPPPVDDVVLRARELLRRVRRIELTSRRAVQDRLAGSYHSIFKGRGMAFSDVRAYAPGDDVRFIDWNVTARTGHLHVKQFVEERELTVLLVIDLSHSMRFGTRGAPKLDLAAELTALLAMSAMRNQDKVGLVTFTDRVETFLRPRKGRAHVLRVIREVLSSRAAGSRTNVAEVLRWLSHALKRQAVVFLVSDFAGAFDGAKNDVEERLLRATARRHDLICIEVVDPLEEHLPDVGLVEQRDAESGERFLVDTTPHVRQVFAGRAREERQARQDLFRRLAVDHLLLRTGDDNKQAVVRFFAARARRAARG